MARDRFSFQGLEPIERRLRRLADDVVYVTVSDRTDRKSEEMLGRFELTLADALPYLDDVPDDDWDDPDEDPTRYFGAPEDLDDEQPDDDEDDESPEPAPLVRHEEHSQARYAEAACRWLRDIAVRNTVGEPYRRFRMKAYGPKGMRVVDTGTFVCRNEGYDLDLPLGAAAPSGEGQALQIPSPTFEQVETAGAAKGIKALGDYYAQWGRIVLGSMGQLQHVNNDMQSRLHRQLQESRSQVDELVAAILEFRAAEMKMGAERAAEEKATDTRTLLAQQALQQLGEAAKAFLAAKGVSPEMADVLGAIGQSPDLVAALSDPDVKTLMQDPDNLRALAGMLKGAAVQARAAREAAAQMGGQPAGSMPPHAAHPSPSASQPQQG